MAVDKSLVSGSTTMLVLKLLEEKDMYGYEMIDTLRGKSKNVSCMDWRRKDSWKHMKKKQSERSGSITTLQEQAKRN